MLIRLEKLLKAYLFPSGEFLVSEDNPGFFSYRVYRGLYAHDDHSFFLKCKFSSVRSAYHNRLNFTFYLPAVIFFAAAAFMLYASSDNPGPAVGMTLCSVFFAAAGRLRSRNYNVFLDYRKAGADFSWEVKSLNKYPVWMGTEVYGGSDITASLRIPASFSTRQHGFMKVLNEKVISVGGSNDAVYFFPDFLIIEKTRFAEIYPYRDIALEYGENIFDEKSFPVKNALTVGKTHLHVNKNGSPDRRFSHNPEVNRNVYAFIRIFRKNTVMSEVIFSDIESGYHFAQFMAKKCFTYSEKRRAKYFHRRKVKETYSDRERRKWEENREKRRKSFYSNRKKIREDVPDDETSAAYLTLGLENGVTASEIKSAYRSLVKKYHPDRTGDRNDDRVKQIIRAYEILTRSAS